MSDSARKRTIADWVVKIKKQVVKLYVVVKWARDARDVQKAMVRLIFSEQYKEMFDTFFEEHYSVPDGAESPIRRRGSCHYDCEGEFGACQVRIPFSRAVLLVSRIIAD